MDIKESLSKFKTKIQKEGHRLKKWKEEIKSHIRN